MICRTGVDGIAQMTGFGLNFCVFISRLFYQEIHLSGIAMKWLRRFRFTTFEEFFLLDMERLPALDGIRACAILMVFNVHLFGGYSSDNYFAAQDSFCHKLIGFFNAGHVGVDILFILSGFLIYLTIANGKDKNLRKFLFSRGKRLMPALILLNVPFIISFTVKNGINAVLLETVIDNTLYLKIFRGTSFLNYPTWTLTYEIYFYIVAGVWLISLSGIRHLFRLAAFSILALMFLLSTHIINFYPIDNPTRFLGFFYGILLASAYLNRNLWENISKYFNQAWPFAIALFVCAGWYWSAGNADRIQGSVLRLNIFYTAIDISAFILIGSLLAKPGPSNLLSGLLSSKPLRAIGVMSYSFFLIHAMYGISATRYFLHYLQVDIDSLSRLFLLYACALAFTLACSCVLFCLFERPYYLSRARRGTVTGGRNSAA